MAPTTTGPKTTLSRGPHLKDDEAGVHIIHVPLSLISEELHMPAAIEGAAATVTLAQVEKHIGQPFPTDIIVFGVQPWQFAGRPGQARHLERHPQVHHRFPETVLVLSIGNQDKAVWWSEKDFAITAVTPSGAAHPIVFYPEAPTPVPPNPIALTRTIELDVDGKEICCWRSSVPIAAAERHMYKIAFQIDGDAIDPDMYCAP